MKSETLSGAYDELDFKIQEFPRRHLELSFIPRECSDLLMLCHGVANEMIEKRFFELRFHESEFI